MESEARHALIYVLVDPRDGEIRYVGWTTQTLAKRFKSHLTYKSRAHRSKWIQLLVRQDLRPIIRLIQTVTVEDGPSAEIYWIKFHRELGCRLVNSTEGGEGAPGHIPTEETRAKMSAAHRGRKHSPGTLAKLRHAKLNQSAETRAKIGEANRRRNQSQVTRDKIATARRGKPLSTAHREKLREVGFKRKLTVAERQKVSEAAKQRWAKRRKAQVQLSAP